MPVVHPGRDLEAERPLLQDRPGARPVQGPGRSRDGPRDDPRGGRGAACSRTSSSRYRQLPMIVYHFQTKFRDEPRSRGGLIRVREFVMKDSYSCDRDWDGLERSYQLHYEAYAADLRAARARGDRGRRRRRDHGRHRGPRVHGPQRRSARTCWSCATPATTRPTVRSPRSAGQAIAGRRGPPADGGRRDAGRDDDRRAGRVPRIDPGEPDRQGRLLRDRRRPVRGRRSSAATTTSRRRSSSTRSRPSAASGPAQLEEIKAARHGGRLRLADRRPATHRSWSTSWSRASPNLVAGANRVGWHIRNVNVGARLHARRRRRHRQRDGTATPARPAARRSSCATGSRSATSSSSGRTSPSRSGHTTSARTAASTRS